MCTLFNLSSQSQICYREWYTKNWGDFVFDYGIKGKETSLIWYNAMELPSEFLFHCTKGIFMSMSWLFAIRYIRLKYEKRTKVALILMAIIVYMLLTELKQIGRKYFQLMLEECPLNQLKDTMLIIHLIVVKIFLNELFLRILLHGWTKESWDFMFTQFPLFFWGMPNWCLIFACQNLNRSTLFSFCS